MQYERIQVTNHERWGNLVKTWSTGHTKQFISIFML
jgi:hypothetical protein